MSETPAARRVNRDRPARFLHRLHFYAGLMVGPFLLIAAISGAFYALAPTIEKVVYADLLTVDPATAAVVGEERTYSGLGELPVRRWLSGLHQQLHLGEPGELYAELAASWLWVLALGGLYLWWRRVSAARRRDPGTRTRLWRAAPAPAGDAGRRRRSLNLHAVLGVWLIVAMLGLAATGITWSQRVGANVDAVVSALDWKAPKVDATLPPESPGAGRPASPAQADRVIAVGLGIAAIIVLGYRMWWLRRPTVRGTSVPGLPDVPSWRIVAGVVVFAATVGAFLPLLGMSMIGFLLLDLVLIGRSRARRRAVEKQREPAILSGGVP